MPDLYLDCIRACLRRDFDSVRHCMQDSRWNWERLFEQASSHSVLPSVSLSLELQRDLVDDPEAARFLSTVGSLNRERNSRILDELRTVARLLNQLGMEPILLKGAAYLATGVYADPAERYLVDIDLLLPDFQIPAAAQVLIANGFLPDQGDNFARFRHHHPPLRRPESVSIEIHHQLGTGPCASLLPAAEVIERSVPHDLDGVSVRVPCPEHLMTHLILHSQLQHPYQERIWLPLRAAFDLVKLENRFGRAIDWPAIEQRFRYAGRHGLLTLHLLQVRDYLGLELPIASPLKFVIRIRAFRRKLLRRLPAIRYFDPLYMFSTLCIRRLRVIRNILTHPGGPRFLVGQLLQRPVYKRLFIDVVEGRGRT